MPSDLSRKIAEAVLSMQPDPFRDPVEQTADMIERAGVGKLEDSYAKLFSENLALHKGVIGGEQQRDALAKRLAAVVAFAEPKINEYGENSYMARVVRLARGEG